MSDRIAFGVGGAAAIEADAGVLKLVRDDESGTITAANAAEKFPAFMAIPDAKFPAFLFWFHDCGPQYRAGQKRPQFYTKTQVLDWAEGKTIEMVECWVRNRNTGRKFPVLKWKISGSAKAATVAKKATRITI